MPRNSEIPRFDLAEQILSEQRKITAIRRKAPNKAARLGGGSPSRSGVARRSSPCLRRGKPVPAKAGISRPSFLSGLFQEQQQTRLPRVSNEGEDTSEGWYGGQVIAEIVARDIEKLCGRPAQRWAG